MLGFIKKRIASSKLISVDNVLPGVIQGIYDVIVPTDASLIETAIAYKCPNCNCSPTDFGDAVVSSGVGDKCIGTMWNCPKCKKMTYFHKKIEKYTFGKKTAEDISSLL